MILFDNLHLSSNRSIPELLKFGRRVGLKPEWLQRSNKGIIHFDCTTEGMKKRILATKVSVVSPKDLFRGAIRGDLPEIVRQVPKRAKIQLKRSNGLIKRTPIKRKHKTTGELALFRKLWDERPRICFVSGNPLKHFDLRIFAHVLSKKQFGRYRLNPENIVFLEPDIHRAFDAGTQLERDNRAIALREDWDKLYRLKDRLKQEYRLITSSSV